MSREIISERGKQFGSEGSGCRAELDRLPLHREEDFKPLGLGQGPATHVARARWPR